MPCSKEGGAMGERGHSTHPASKNAKERSNSATLRASRARAHAQQHAPQHAQQHASGRGSRCNSEKDSGYSDTASDSLQTDEDQRSHASDLQSHSAQLAGNAHVLVPNSPELTSIFIIKNVVLKQPGQVQTGQEHLLQTPLSWGAGGSASQGPTHVLLLQQSGVAPPVTPLHVLKPPNTQVAENAAGKKDKNTTYLPILNSYPRIAPHPTKKTTEKPLAVRAPVAEEPSLRKRVCVEERREEVSTTSTSTPSQGTKQLNLPAGQRPPRPHQRTPPLGCETLAAALQGHRAPPRPPPRAAPPSVGLGSPSVSSSETASCEFGHAAASRLQATRGREQQGSVEDVARGSTRHWRFLNTVEILSQSGLLDITLRTQELLRQSTATERDIAQLRQHAQLLCQAMQAPPPRTPHACEALRQAMERSGHYPDLKCLGTERDGGAEMEADTSTEPEMVICRYGYYGGEEVAPPSPLLAPMPDLGQLVEEQQGGVAKQGSGHWGYANPDDLLMPPDSSTNSSLL